MGPNYERPKLPTPPAHRFVEAPTQAQSLADMAWFQVFDDPALQALIREAIANNLDLRVALAHVEEARARAGIAKSYLYPQVDGTVNYGVRGATSTEENNDTTHQSGVYGFQLSWEIDLFGRLRRGQESAIALALASEQGRRGVLVTLVGDVASNYFLLRELDLQMQIARETLRLNDETVTYFRNRLDGGVSNRLELDRIVALRQQTATAIPEIERQMAVIENLISLLLGRPPNPVNRQASDQHRAAAAADSTGPPGLAARAPPRRRRGRTDSRRGERRYRRRQVAVLSDHQPDRVSRRRQRRSHDVPRRNRRRVVPGRRPVSADLPGRADSPEPRGGPGAIRRRAGRISESRAQQLPRGRQRAGHDPEAGGAARPRASWASPPCRTRPICRVSGTSPASRATSKS